MGKIRTRSLPQFVRYTRYVILYLEFPAFQPTASRAWRINLEFKHSIQVGRINLKLSQQQRPSTGHSRVRVRVRCLAVSATLIPRAGVGTWCGIRVYTAVNNNQYKQTGSTPWVYPQLGVRKNFQFVGGARNACVLGVHSRLGSSSARNKAPGIPQ